MMKFKLVEKFDDTRDMVQEYMYDAIDELKNASLEEYIQWFNSELTYCDERVEQAVTDAYIEACDYGMIKGVEKTRLTSQLKEYIESHTDIIEDTAELMRQCPDHLQHELKIVLSKLDESLTEELLTEVTKRTLQDFARSLKPKLTGNLKAVVNTKTSCVDLVDGETIVAQVYPSFEQKEKTYKTLIRIQDKDDILPSDEIYVKREKTGNKNVISGVGQVKRVSGVYSSIEDAFN